MTESNGRKRRARIPFQERLAEVDAQIKAARERVSELEKKREWMIKQQHAAAKDMLAGVPELPKPVAVER